MLVLENVGNEEVLVKLDKIGICVSGIKPSRKYSVKRYEEKVTLNQIVENGCWEIITISNEVYENLIQNENIRVYEKGVN